MVRALHEPSDPGLNIHPLPVPIGATAAVLVLTGELDVRTVTILCDTAIAHIQAGHLHLRLDLSQVTRCDNASLYTIIGLQHALHTADGNLDLTAASAPVEQAIHRNNLSHILHT